MTERHKLVIIGAGPGGICTAIRLLQEGYDDFVVLEQAPGVGGTWFHNRYPGAECDVMSHFYSFEFELNPEWSQRYARQPEILAYLEHCVEKYGVTPHLRLGTRVRRAVWDEDAATWTIETASGDRFEAQFVVSALGLFNEPVWPAIEGRESFAGRAIHSARWPDDLDLAGRRVAVVGSAASAIQLVPEVAKEAAQLLVFQRTAVWVLPKDDRPYTDADREQFRSDADAMPNLRAKLETGINSMMTFTDPGFLAQSRQAGLENLAVVEDPDTRDRLTPRLPWGSRRPIVSNEYYPAFNRDNVHLVTDPITRMTPSGIVTADGTEHEVDVVVFATGFDTTRFLSVIDVRGRDGVRIEDAWADDPVALLGVVTAGFPNLFMLYGPNTNNGSIIRMLEHQVEFVIRFVELMDAEGITWADVRPEAVAHFNRRLQRELDAIEVWSTEHDGYYRGRSGRIVTQWPASMDDYRDRLADISMVAFEYARA